MPRIKINNLATLYPEVADEWDYEQNAPLRPEMFTAHARKKVWWICRKSHRWAAAIRDRTGKGRGCPFCSGRYPVPGETDLATLYPDIAHEWDYVKNGNISPTMVASQSGKSVWWLCEKGHSWRAIIQNRTKHGSGCPYCSGRTAIPGETDLKTIFPDIAAQWDYEKNGSLLPEEATPHSTRKAWWVCDIGHSWQTSIKNRTSGNAGCPYCSGLKAIQGQTDLSTIFPDIAAEWDVVKNGELRPEMVTAYSGKKAWWVCSKGHSWQATVENRTRQGTGCPYCTGRRAIPFETDLKTMFPDIALQWDYEKNNPLLPEMISAHSGRKVWWLCNKGHSWFVSVNDRTRLDRRCPYCAGRRKYVKSR